MDIITELDEIERTLRILAANPLTPTAHGHIRTAASKIRAVTMRMRSWPVQWSDVPEPEPPAAPPGPWINTPLPPFRRP